MTRFAVRMLLLAAALTLSACALTPLPRGEPAQALPLAEDTRLDRDVGGLVLGPGESAYRLVEGAEDAFVLRMRTAQLAGRSLDVQYYMWHDDLTGRLIAGELLAAAERGVRVRVLVDDLYVQGLETPLANVDAHPNLEIRVYNPFRSRGSLLGKALELASDKRYNRRMHNKLWIADGRLAIVGGRNIGDEYFGAHETFNFSDLGVLLAGHAVGTAGRQFDAYWNSESAIPLTAFAQVTDSKAAVAEALAAFAAHRESAAGTPYARHLGQLRRRGALGLHLARMHQGSDVTMLADDPAKTTRKRDRPLLMLEAVRKLLADARTEAIVVSPYFVPMRGGAEGLVSLEQRGVEVEVLTNSLAANDVAAVHGGYSRWRRKLLGGGVVLYELKPISGQPVESSLGSSRASLHTKAMLIDGRTSFIGSFNLDPRSARLNTESGVVIEDVAFAKLLRTHYEEAKSPALSWQVRLDGRELVWDDVVDGRPVVLRREPEASLGRRLQAWLFRLLPLDKQL
jgi:cardiolipin synthase C